MRRTRILHALFLVFSLPVAGSGEHSPLVPRPQQIQYGPGGVPLRSLSIRLASPADAEDRFAAESLAKDLSALAGKTIVVGEGGAAGPAIVLERTGAPAPIPVAGERPGPESREAYTLKVTSRGAEIRAKSSAGLFYGTQTLRQLVEGKNGEASLPEVEIHDWPAIAYRGVMMDMSHGPLLTEEEVKRQIEFLARWKGNQYYFYSEASIELEGYPLLNPGARFSQDEVKRVIEYARLRHVDVVPCLELYGHLHDLFRIERYSSLAAVAHGGEFNPRKPEVATLLAGWVDQFARLFPSPFIHVGMDETWELERYAKAEAQGLTPGELYLEHFRKVATLARERGKNVMVWGDIFRKYPQIIPQLPPGTTIVAWNYGPESDYSKFLSPFASAPVSKFVATGVTLWNQILPDFALSFENIDSFLATGRRFGLEGHINTIWTDDAQVLVRSAYPGIAYGAAAAWEAAPKAHSEFFSEYARLMYPPAVAAEVAPALKSLASAEQSLQNALGRQTMHRLWDDPLAPANLKASEAHREDLKQTRISAEDAQERLERALSLGGDRATLSSFLVGARLLDYAGMRNIYAVEIADFWRSLGPHPKREDLRFLLFSEINYHDHGRTADLMDAITELKEPYRVVWLEGYHPYRLGAALGKWDAEFQYWWRLKKRLDQFADGFHDGDALPPLDSFSPERYSAGE